MRLSLLRGIALAISGFIALQPSYVHPDEHFQSLEMLAVRYLGVAGSVPWEFQPVNAARSFAPLILNYGPLYFFVVKYFRIRDSMTILSLVRLQNYLVYISLCHLVFRRLSATRGLNSRRTDFLVATSYLTCSFQSHSFSNSLETILLLMVLALYNELLIPRAEDRKVSACKASVLIGFLVLLGTFNRITFPAFVFLPSLAVFRHYYRFHIGQFALLVSASALSCILFVQIDTSLYHSNVHVIAPLNNLFYNFKESNLQLHGLHPRYNHLLLNMPQIIGPAALFLNPRRLISQDFTRNLPLLSVVSGLLLLSAFKHQELRFLLPLAPQIFLSLGDRSFIKRIQAANITSLWLAFNIVLAVVMGIYHQGGIIKVISSYQRNDHPVGVHIWWKTYSPPTWMYMNENLTVSTTAIENDLESIEHIPFDILKNHIVDLKGCDNELLNATLHQFLQHGISVNLIAPNSVKGRVENLHQEGSLAIKSIMNKSNHLDLDHLDFGDLSTFALGITVYEVSLL